jgi:hypothetical protein
MKLDDSQRMALRDLSQKLAHAARNIPAAGRGLEPDVSNTFGILGPRGAGKSTLLYELSGEPTLKKITVVPPIDCSVIPPDVAPGAAILIHILNQLKEPERRDLAQAQQKLEGLAERYAENTESFRRLNLELASSQGDYKHAVLSGMRHRFSLQEELRDWLSGTLSILGKDAFLVLLDDFDLVEADGVRRWIYSLLDELRQGRLLFVLTADYYRLEHLGFNPRLEFDDKTGRSFVDKLLPVQNRCDLGRWVLKSRASFSLRGNGPRRRSASDDRQIPLRQLMERYSLRCKVQWALLGRLLPGWPRGLVNLYRDLESKAAGGLATASPDETEYRRFLSILASCRSEYLLARKLNSTPFSNWPRSLNFSHTDLSVEDWQAAVDIALSRTDPDVELKPLPLYPGSSLQMPQSERHRLELEQGGKRETPLVPTIVLLNPSEPDRLRHDDLRTLPLQDAQESSLPYWSELLLNYSFLASDQEEATRNRIRFLEDWTPAAKRLKQARFNIQLTRWQLRQFFETSPTPIPHSALLWMTWKVMEEPTVEIGWPAMLLGLRGGRDPMLSDQLADLLIGSASMAGPLPARGEAKTLAFIPSELWAMVVLTDSLYRCPWQAFSAKPGWLLSTYLKLAVAFVRSAYIHALVATRLLSAEGVTSAQSRLLTALTTLDPSSLLEFQEEEMLEILEALFSEGVPASLCQAGDPLSISAKAFLESSVYRGVVDLQLPAQ